MSEYTKGPWRVMSRRTKQRGDLEISDSEGMWQIAEVGGSNQVSNANLIAASPDLIEESKSTDQGYDWFREQLENFKLYQGSWTLEVGEDWADSLVAHINSRQIGTRAAIAKAEGK